MNKKIVVIFNLGGPDSLANVKLFLFNLFNDKRIIQLIQPFRAMLAWLIANSRAFTARNIYSHIGNKSPIVEQTELQAKALEKQLQKHGNYKVFVAMRYWHPMVCDIIDAIVEYDPNEIILLPLYPQLSTTTTLSFFDHWEEKIKDTAIANIVAKKICCYYKEENFIKAHVDLINRYYVKDHIVLFSAHGLPQKIIAQGDPYEKQVHETVNAIIKKLDMKSLEYKICYQSKVGRLKWLEPSTEKMIKNLGALGKNIVIVPIAFVSEHSETLVELDVEYKELAKKSGIKSYIRVPALQTHTYFIKSLTKLVLNANCYL